MSSATQTGKVRELFLNSIRALTEALEAKDPYTAGHSRRVTEFSVEIALEMALSRNDVAQIRLAAMLHDVGKIGVRESVLNKEGRLTAEEYDHVMQHAQIGRRILEPMFRGSNVLEIVTHHHERFDGTGRPDGLRGTRIPLGARVIALADTVDAMESVRPYRPSRSAREIVEELRKCSGIQFDPKVVEAFFRANHGQELLRQEEQSQTVAQEDLEMAFADGGGTADATAETDAPTETEEPAEREEPRDARAEEVSTEFGVPAAPPPEPLLTRKEVMSAVAERLDLKALPFVTAEILQLTGRADSDIGTLVETILRDPALVAKILKLSNTSFYSLRGRVQTVERAVVNIGYSGIRELAMAVSVVTLFECKDDGEVVDRFALWKHNLACAALCRAIANKGGKMPAEDAFVAGLLHDLGIAALADMFPDQYGRCVEYAVAKGVPLAEAERAFMGVEHTAVAAELSVGWRIDERFRMPMALHHDPWAEISGMPTEHELLVSAVKLADLLARARGEGSDCDMVLEDVPRATLRKLKLDGNAIVEILGKLKVELMELEAVFLLHYNPDAKKSEPEEHPELVGRNALFVDALDKPMDVVKVFLESLGMKPYTAEDVKKGVDSQRPDLVVIHGADESALTANLRELAELADAGTVGAVKVLVLGKNSVDGRLASIYPSNMTAIFEEPYGISAIKQTLAMLFSN